MTQPGVANMAQSVKSMLRAALAALALGAAATSQALPVTLNFDDGVYASVIANGYAGFDWNNFATFDPVVYRQWRL